MKNGLVILTHSVYKAYAMPRFFLLKWQPINQ